MQSSVGTDDYGIYGITRRGTATVSIHVTIFFVFLNFLLSALCPAARVPQKYPPNRELGVWVNKQRMEKKAFDEGKKSSMTEKKVARLEEVGFVW